MLHLILDSELPGAAPRSLAIGPGGAQIGRAPGSDLRLLDDRVSGLHAELIWERDQLVLLHRSRTNTTRVNGEIVADRRALRVGDRITLADSVELRIVESQEPAPAPATERRADGLFVVIVGSGPAGLAAAAQAAVRGVPHVLLERRSIANTIERYQKRKLVMAEPTRLALHPDLPVGFRQSRREEVLDEWTDALRRAGAQMRVGPEHEVVKVEGARGAFRVHPLGGDVLDATHVVIAIGLQGNLRRFGVPGDDLPHVSHQLDDPAAFEGRRIVVVGAGDAGIENALALAEYDNEVSLVNRREEFDRAKAANLTLLEAAVQAGKIALYKNTTVDHFEERCVFVRTPEGVERLEADLVIGRLGAIPPRKFLEQLGIAFPSEAIEAVPVVSEAYESNVPGLHLIGAAAGYPLIKNCLNQGYEVIERILGRDVVPADEPVLAEILAPLGIPVPDAIERIRTTVPLFASLTPIQLREFLFDSKVRRVARGQTVYERNDFENTLLTIVEGRVQVETPKSPERIKLELDAGTRTQYLNDRESFTCGPGEFFGEIGLISGRRRGETVRAASECVLIESPRLAMSRLLNSSSEVRAAIDAAFADRALQRLMPSVAAESRRMLATGARTRRYKPGELLFEQGGESDGLYLIRRGSVSLSQRRDGREVVLQYVQAGNLIGERGLLTRDNRRTASARAKTLVEVLWMPAEAVLTFLAREPEIEVDLVKRLANRVGESGAAIESHRGTVMFLIDQTGAHEATDLLLIDESLCIRCNNCEKACAETHGGISRIDREAGPTYQSSTGALLHVPTACQHCENPKCMDDCPPDALQRDPNGEVYVLDNCIGCGNCARNCPYDVIQMAALERYRPRGVMWRLLFGDPPPDPTLAEGEKKAVKCDLCMELPAPIGGRKKAACVASCPTGAIVRADPRKLVDDILRRA